MAAPVSHGRGGAANIRPDDTVYTDGEIIREGPVGDQGDGAYSAGRGGAGNIDHTAQRTSITGATGDDIVVPETATRIDKEESRHYGRGGAGNEAHVHKHKAEQHGFGKKEEAGHESIGDKIKNVFHHEK